MAGLAALAGSHIALAELPLSKQQVGRGAGTPCVKVSSPPSFFSMASYMPLNTPHRYCTARYHIRLSDLGQGCRPR